jgi:Holliday junction resolvase RusA-like endonuclease
MKLEFFADGTPAPGGSKSAYALTDKQGKLIIKTNPANGRERPVLMWTDDSKGNKAWRQIVGIRAKNRMQHLKLAPFEGPLRFTVEFVITRGKTVKRVHHTTPPDLSKLIRSTEDALTGIAWVDDAQIIEHGPMRKRYALPGEPEGAHILIEALHTQPELELAAAIVARPSPPAPKPLLSADSDSPFD